MATDARYRPAAFSDGMGGGRLSEEQLANPDILDEEADRYARKFIAEEDTAKFTIGLSNYSTNRALVYVGLCHGSGALLVLSAERKAGPQAAGTCATRPRTGQAH